VWLPESGMHRIMVIRPGAGEPPEPWKSPKIQKTGEFGRADVLAMQKHH
jgi:hypothetical protein